MQELIANLKDAARYLLQNGQTKQGLAVQACVTMLEDDSDDKERTSPRRWTERWHGSGPDRGWWVWEAGRGDPIAYIGEGEFSERLCSVIVQKHNEDDAHARGVRATEELGKRTTSTEAASGREIPNADECAKQADASGPRGVSNAAANGGDARAVSGGCAQPIDGVTGGSDADQA